MKSDNIRRYEHSPILTKVEIPTNFNRSTMRVDHQHSDLAPWSTWISYSPELRYGGESPPMMKSEP